MDKVEYNLMITVKDIKIVLEKSTSPHLNANMKSMEVDNSIFNILNKKVQEFERLEPQ